ncbi:hypothetical protein MHYP_G00277400 [Metynnis hypsauchen]
MLHYTLEPDIRISDSSEFVTRENIFTVDCLICEEDLLQCPKNDEALTKAKEWIESEIEKKKPEIQRWHNLALTTRRSPPPVFKAFPVLKADQHPCAATDLTNQAETEELQEVSTEEECDVYLHDIDAAVRILSDLPGIKAYKIQDAPPVKISPVRIFMLNPGKTLGSHKDFVRILCKRRTALQEVLTVEECDVVLVFCPVVSRAGTDIKAALQELSDISATKPAVLVVLHHTFNPDSTLPDSSRAVNREKTLTVDCLFFEDKGLLQCRKNDEALCKVADWLIPEVKEDQPNEYAPPVKISPVRIFTLITGKTLGSHKDFVRILCKRRTALQEVLTVEECDLVLVFCPVVSRAGTDIKAALQELSDISATKPAVLVVLHHTFNPESIVPDSSRAVNREKTLTVDCLFFEDKGLLQCRKNDEALCKVADWLIPEVKEDQPNEYAPPVKISPVRIFMLITGKTLGSHEDFVRILCKQRTELQKVRTVEECDIVLVFCPVFSQAGTDITSACEKLDEIPATKPAVLVVLHHMINPDLIVPDSSRAVKRQNTLIVDCLFYKDKGLLQCKKNDEAFRGVSMWIDTQAENKPESSGQKHLNQKMKYSFIISESTLDSHVTFLRKIPNTKLQEVLRVEECDVILVFCPVVSQAQTDIEAALQRIDGRVKDGNCKEHAVAMEIRWFKGTDCVCLYKNRQVTEGRGYEGRVSLFTQELQRGNISLQIRDFRGSDRGDYLCQVTNGDTTEECIVGTWKVTGQAKLLEDKESLLMKRNAQLVEKDKQIQEKELLLTKNRETLQMKDKMLEEKGRLLMEAESKLAEITKESVMNQMYLKDKDSQLENQIKLLREKETLLEVTEKEEESSKKQLETLRKELQEKSSKLQEMMILLEEQKTEVTHKQKELEEKEQQLKHTDLTERSKQLQESKNILTERDRQLMERERQVQEKDKLLTEAQDELRQTTKKLEDNQRETNERLESVNKQLKDKDSQLENQIKLLREKETLLEVTEKEEESSKKQLETLRKELQEKSSKLQELMILLEEQKTEVTRQQKELEEKEQQLKHTDLTEMSKQLQESKNVLSERDRQLIEREKQVEEKDRLLAEAQDELRQTTKKLENYQRETNERLESVNKQLKDKDSQLENQIKLLREKETLLEVTEKEVESSKKQLETLRKELQDKSSKLQELMILLEQQKTEVTEKDKQLEEKERLLSERNTQLMERDKQVEEKDRLLEERNKQLQERTDPDSAAPARRRNSMSAPPSMSEELRLVLLGRTECGKRAAGNTILGREERSQAGAPTVRQQSESRQGEVAGRQVTVVDTPDWFCPGLSLEELRQDVGLCVHLSAPGPHAFLLVIPVIESTGEERGMMEKMEEIFGERCWRNTMILFTVTDEVQEKNIEEFIQSGNQEVQRLVEKCGNRIHCLNINESGHGSQISELLEKIEMMVKGNREKFYSSEIYLETESQIRAIESKASKLKMQEEFSRQMEEKNTELETLKQRLSQLTETQMLLKEAYQTTVLSIAGPEQEQQ